MADIVYLAVPYSHKDPEVMADRVRQVNETAVFLINQGEIVFSPISHCDTLRQVGKLPETWDFWKKYDLEFLAQCRKLYVLMLDGWKESTGVQAEIQFAKDHHIPIEYI